MMLCDMARSKTARLKEFSSNRPTHKTVATVVETSALPFYLRMILSVFAGIDITRYPVAINFIINRPTGTCIRKTLEIK